MKGKKRVEFVIYGLHPALFCSEVDQYFICPVCYFVVNNPVSCFNCEQIYCEGCINRFSKIKENICKTCKAELKIISVRKFPRKVYESFFLYCPNFNNGCRFEGAIQEIYEHRDKCQFARINCSNPLCAHHFLAKDRTIFEADVCSVQCLETFRLSEMIGKYDRNELSKFFWNCLQDYRKTYSDSIQLEYEELINAGDEAKDKIETEIAIH